MRLKEIVSDIWDVSFNSKRKLASTFLRFQEHYESPEFKGEIFSLEEYRKWYIENSKKGKKTGKFTYHEDWSGFNIPSFILDPFRKGHFDPLSNNEKNFLKLFEGFDKNKFYILGTLEWDQGILDHEVAHGLFYTNNLYKKQVLAVLKDLCPESFYDMISYLHDLGYHDDVLQDEIQAWLLTDLTKLEENGVCCDDLKFANLKLRNIFKQYYVGD